MAEIVWVEDQFHWIDRLSRTLEQADLDGQAPNELTVFKFADAAKQHLAARKEAPDVLLLDANMQGNDDAGFSISRLAIKKWPNLPIIYLSEHSGTGIEQHALEQSQAQDFIAKHQNNIEQVLCWRLKRVLAHKAALSQDNSAMLVSGPLKIDTQTWNVYWYEQRLMNPKNPARPLAPTPRKILRFLVEVSPRPLTTEQIAERLDADLEKFSYANYRQHVKTLRHSFAQITNVDFVELCKQGQGVVTVGDMGAYAWVAPHV